MKAHTVALPSPTHRQCFSEWMTYPPRSRHIGRGLHVFGVVFCVVLTSKKIIYIGLLG